MEIIFGLLIWIGIVLVSVLVFLVLGKKYFSAVQGWEDKKTSSTVWWGLIAIVLSSAAFFFLPITVVSMFASKLKDAGKEIAGMENIPGIARSLVNFSKKMILKLGPAVIAFAGTSLCSLVLLVWGILMQIREKQKKAKDEYDRKKLFSYREDELKKINGK